MRSLLPLVYVGVRASTITAALLRHSPLPGGALDRALRQPAPIEFDRLRHLLDDEPALLADIGSLLAKKRAAPEMALATPVPGIHAFIERELERLEGVTDRRRRGSRSRS